MRKIYPLVAIALAMSMAGCTCKSNGTKNTLKNKGEACNTDTECVTGLCDAPPGKDKSCLTKCTSGCDSTEVCISLGTNRYGCVPEKPGLCGACTTDSDCPYPGDLCISLAGGEKFCGRDCSFDSKCPATYTCVTATDKSGNQIGLQCEPKSGSCTCTPDSAGQMIPCAQTNSFGSCMGMQTCLGDSFSACDARIPATEACNGIDDDCNGKTDENLGTKSCGMGECMRTVDNCVDGGAGVCTPGDAGVEVCDEKDNNCNGVIDDGFDKVHDINNCGMCGLTCSVMNGTPECDGGNCEVANCNMPFADCDKQYPTGCETNTDTDVNNCGGCNQPCARANEDANCVGGTCQYMCKPGFVDLNGDPSDGCEYTCTFISNSDLPDLGFVDANCDGIDGEVANGVFVSTTGNDANAGDKAHPKRTITAAINALNGKRDVYVSTGTYIEQISIPSNVGVYGGYNPNNWQRDLTANPVTVTGVNAPLLIDGSMNVSVQLMQFVGSTPSGSGVTAYGAFVRNAVAVLVEAVDIRAGNGTPGSSGSSSSAGASGAQGSIGGAGCENSSFVCNSCNQPQGGAGGHTTCHGVDRYGGQGGSAGQGGSSGNGGAQGYGGTAQGSGTPSGGGNNVPGSGYIGGTGGNGGAGAQGTSGGAFGSWSASGYVLAITSDGAEGGDGNGGGGGGGGGGGTTDCDSYGGGGGGGGAGACGGQGGHKGTSGGASVAMFLWNSSVTAKGASLHTGNGGSGGNGTQGGGGGTGGAGGQTASGAGSNYGGGSEQDDGSNGARGGKGGDGGNGGPGGAGGGGPVVGVGIGGTSTWSPDPATTIQLGTPGNGGTTFAPAANGLNGESDSTK
ncbi:MAG: MopE-related protein [Myxococcaceae bacterium]